MVDRFDDRVWVEKIKFNTTAALDATAWQDRDGVLGALLAGISDATSIGTVLSEMQSEWQNLRSLLPTDPRLCAAELDWDDEDVREALLSEARELLVGKLLETGDAT
jgi:hypothetical protein